MRQDRRALPDVVGGLGLAIAAGAAAAAAGAAAPLLRLWRVPGLDVLVGVVAVLLPLLPVNIDVGLYIGLSESGVPDAEVHMRKHEDG